MRTKPRPSFSLSSLFGGSSKKNKDAKSTKGSSATTFSNQSTSAPQPYRAQGNGPIRKEYEILGLQSDPRKVYYQPAARPEQSYAHAPPPSKKPSYVPQKPTKQTTHKPKAPTVAPHPSARKPVPSQRPHPHPQRGAPAPLRVPLRSPDLERGHPISPVSPISSSASLRTFVTRSSGVFPRGREPNAIDDYDEHVLMLPTPPKAAKSYGNYRVMPRY
ncbi:hypothetical protein BJX70DRAFT_394922 [Aspergillus crustosus]